MTRIRSRYNRLVAAALAIAATLCATPVEAQQPIHVTDIAGRDVTLAGPAKRILLGQGRHLPALALIHPDPVSLLVGWQGDMRRTDAPTYALYRDKFPALDSLPIVGEGNPESFSIEKALALKPDVAVLSLYVAGMRHGSTAPSSIVQRFEAAGIPVVIVDFFANPLRDTVPSIRILGKITGRDQAADELVNFYQKHVAYLKETIAANHPELPTVFMHAHAGGNECCYSSGKGTFDDFISLAGGRNIAAGVIPGSTGEISLEFLIAKNPDVYVATGGDHLARSGGFVLGTGVDAAAARTRLNELISRPGLSGLSAVTSGRAHGLWHMFPFVSRLNRTAKRHPNRLWVADLFRYALISLNAAPKLLSWRSKRHSFGEPRHKAPSASPLSETRQQPPHARAAEAQKRDDRLSDDRQRTAPTAALRGGRYRRRRGSVYEICILAEDRSGSARRRSAAIAPSCGCRPAESQP